MAPLIDEALMRPSRTSGKCIVSKRQCVGDFDNSSFFSCATQLAAVYSKDFPAF